MFIRAFIATFIAISFLMIGCSGEPPRKTTPPIVRTTPTATPTPTPTVTKVELSEAESKKLVKVSVSGSGLESVQLSLESMSNDSLEIKITPGTIFKASSGGTQNMVVRAERTIQLKSRGSKESLTIDAACANMNKATPEGNDTFSISQTAASEDLQKLLTLPEFRKQNFRIQQFAIWTITDNPSKYGYVGIGASTYGGYGSAPSESEFQSIKKMFEEAGISTKKYRALR